MKRHLVARVASKLLIPPILLFALYVQFHGDFGPGGGFQAGVIFASAFVVYCLIFGLDDTDAVATPRVVAFMVPLGVLLFAGVGVAAMLMGGDYLDYSVLAHDAHHGQHYGILLVELGVGITVAAAMVQIFVAFARRPRMVLGDDPAGPDPADEMGYGMFIADASLGILSHYNYQVVVVLMMIGLYAAIARQNLVKKLIGLSIFQVGVFFLYISMGKVAGGTAPILGDDVGALTNPIPHVLILTAIVVGVATTSLGLALVVRIHEAYGTIEEDELQAMERAP